MRVFILLITIGFSSAFANPNYSQTKIDINVANVSLENLFKDIQNKSEFVFFYKDDVLNKETKVSLKLNKVTLSTILDKAFINSGLTYKIIDRQVIIKKSIKTEKTATLVKKNNQTAISISGLVLDNTGQPLPGASILEKGTTNGTETDFDGNFSLNVANQKAILVVSYIGFLTQEINIDNKTKLTITLQEDAASLDEIVVVGYGKQSRKKVTGSISSVKSDQIADLPVTSFDQALAGQISGVQVSQGTGSPGEASNIKIRGTGTLTAGSNPLLVIDGFPSESIRMSDINPNDIEGIQVLKDAASSSIYGSRGSNGVILVSTKKGKNKETKISVNTYTGFQSVSNTYKMANGYQWAEYQMETLRERNAANFPANYVPSGYAPYLAGTQGLNSTDWQDEIFRTAPINSYQLSVSGGNENTKFYVSGEYFDQEGIIINSDYTRYNFRSNIESDIFKNEENTFLKNIKLGVNLAPTYSTSNKVSESHHSADGIVITALYAYPNFAAYKPDGSLNIGEQIRHGQSATGLKNNGWRGENPVAVALQREQLLKRVNILGSTYLDFSLTDDLNFKTYLGVNYSNSEQNIFRPSTIGKRQQPAPIIANGRLDINRTFNWISENTFNYKKTINENHNFDVLLGYSFQKEKLFASFLTSDNSIANNFAAFNLTNVITGGDTIEEEWSLISYLSRVNYDFNGKYLISASFRRDGSSRFGDDSKWGNFPSVSLGWRASEEDFLNESESISDLKLRASWGITGNNLIPNYGGTALLGNANYGGQGGFFTATIPDPNLSWEETSQIDFGVDLGFFDNKISIIADYYKSTTDGLLLNVPVPSQSGFTSQLKNLGEVENKGFEFAISANKIKLGEVEWSSTFNVSSNKNKVISLGGQNRITSKFHKTEVGKPIGEFYLWNITGVYNTQAEIDATAHIPGTAPGDYIIEDVNGDNVINDSDRKVMGNSQPDFTYGLSTTFKYKGFDLTTLLQGAVGNDILNFNYFFISRRGDFANVLSERVEGRWQSASNPGTGFARAGAREDHYDASNKLLQKGDFLRFRNITLGYTLPEQTLEKLGMDKVRIYLSSINPFTFTKYKGYNPEVNGTIGLGADGSPLEPGVDWGNYPSTKSITIGVNLTF